MIFPFWTKSKAKVALLFTACVLAGYVVGCTLQGINPLNPQISGKSYPIKPEVSIKIDRSDRIEFFAGGLHVGTVIFDAYGNAMWVGDTTQLTGVLNELLGYLEMLRSLSEQDGDTSTEPQCYNKQTQSLEPCPSA